MQEEAKQMARPLAVLNGYLGPVIMSNANCAQQQHRSKCQKPSSPFEKFVKIVAAVGSRSHHCGGAICHPSACPNEMAYLV